MGKMMTRSELATTMPDSAFRTQEVRRVVVAIDLTPAGLDALHEAAHALKGWSRGELHVVHVSASDHGPVTASTIAKNERSIDEGRDELRKFVLTHAHELPSFGRVETVLHLRYGDAETMIRDVCADVAADLLVLGVDEQTGIRGLLHPSLPAALVKSAHCPVLVAKPKTYDSVETNGHDRVSIEPPCADCVKARAASGNENAWCERHAVRHGVTAHAYGYDETLSFQTHDNETMGPTGV